MSTYKLEDIEARDPLDFIRRHPSMFVGDPPWGPQLALSLMRDLMLLDALPARIERRGNWWKIEADKRLAEDRWRSVFGAIHQDHSAAAAARSRGSHRGSDRCSGRRCGYKWHRRFEMDCGNSKSESAACSDELNGADEGWANDSIYDR
jgi:hypothetical protein